MIHETVKAGVLVTADGHAFQNVPVISTPPAAPCLELESRDWDAQLHLE